MSAVLKSPSVEERLARFLPLRIIARKQDDGRYAGLVEHSFSMDWQAHRVLIFWSGKAYSILGECVRDAAEEAIDSQKSYPGSEVFDPLSPECPVAVDLASWLDAIDQRPGNKFDKRNAFFEQR